MIPGAACAGVRANAVGALGATGAGGTAGAGSAAGVGGAAGAGGAICAGVTPGVKPAGFGVAPVIVPTLVVTTMILL